MDLSSIISLRFSDINGVLKEVLISEREFERAVSRGIWFDGSSIEGFARRFESDMMLVVDSSAHYTVNGVKTYFCDVYKNGAPFDGDPRTILKDMLMRLEKNEGFTFIAAGELEFYVLKDGEPIDGGSYFDVSPRDKANAIKIRIAEKLSEAGIEWSISHHEVGPGQNEVDILHDQGLRIADKTLLTKNIIKLVCESMDLKASFMPKPFHGKPGNGFHIHMSIWAGEDNLFYDERDPYGLSGLARNFIAGIFEHVDGITAIANPTVNSYKRLGEFEAPKYVYWGMKNRDALIRVPEFRGKAGARIEYRAPDPSSNPYLLFTVLLAAGMDGVKRNLEPPEPIEKDIYEYGLYRDLPTLPQTLEKALDALEEDKLLRSSLRLAGENFIKLKRQEWEDYATRRITDWEYEKYFDV